MCLPCVPPTPPPPPACLPLSDKPLSCPTITGAFGAFALIPQQLFLLLASLTQSDRARLFPERFAGTQCSRAACCAPPLACAIAVVAGALLLVPRGACSSWLAGMLCVNVCVSICSMKHAWLWFASGESSPNLHDLIPDCAKRTFCHCHIFPLMDINYTSDFKCACF